MEQEKVSKTYSTGEALDEMIADYMEKGFLDNIVDMFRYNGWEHVGLVAKLIKDERLRVRIGAIALVESLKEMGLPVNDAVSDTLVPLLTDESPAVVGDALYCLGFIGDTRHLQYVRHLIDDENAEVAATARDTIEAIEQEAANRQTIGIEDTEREVEAYGNIKSIS